MVLCVVNRINPGLLIKWVVNYSLTSLMQSAALDHLNSWSAPPPSNISAHPSVYAEELSPTGQAEAQRGSDLLKVMLEDNSRVWNRTQFFWLPIQHHHETMLATLQRGYKIPSSKPQKHMWHRQELIQSQKLNWTVAAEAALGRKIGNGFLLLFQETNVVINN